MARFNTGVTSNLVKRVWEHKSDLVEGFARRYAVHMLAYFELLDTMEAGITRERQIKAGSRAKKIQLIESMNIGWQIYTTALCEKRWVATSAAPPRNDGCGHC